MWVNPHGGLSGFRIAHGSHTSECVCEGLSRKVELSSKDPPWTRVAASHWDAGLDKNQAQHQHPSFSASLLQTQYEQLLQSLAMSSPGGLEPTQTFLS